MAKNPLLGHPALPPQVQRALRDSAPLDADLSPSRRKWRSMGYPKRAGGLPGGTGSTSPGRSSFHPVTGPSPAAPDITEARRLFPATTDRAYLNTASVGLASTHLAWTYHRVVDHWNDQGFDFPEGERAANAARAKVARLIGADADDVALIPSVSSVA